MEFDHEELFSCSSGDKNSPRHTAMTCMGIHIDDLSHIIFLCKIKSFCCFLQTRLKPIGVTNLLPKTGFSEQLLASYLEIPPAGKMHSSVCEACCAAAAHWHMSS